MAGIEVVGLLFATAGFIKLIVDVGEKVSQRVAELGNAERLIVYLADFGVESSRKTLQLQLELGQSICNDPHVDDGVKDVLDKTFIEIQKSLNAASDQVESALAARKKLSWFIVERKNRQALEASVSQLKTLARNFRDTVYLVRTERTSHSALFLPKNIFQVFEKPIVQIADNISLRTGQLSSNLGNIAAQTGRFVLEKRPYAENSELSKEELEDDVKDLTKILASTSGSEGILDVVGYANDSKAECFNLVFAIPKHLDFQGTLQTILRDSTQVPPLEVRLFICTQLAESVLHVHRLGLVHKNINPMSIMVMKSTDKPDVNQPETGPFVFLLDWHLVRRASDATNRAGQNMCWKGMYCHPKRQMEVAQEEYNMGHDIYSLGVCMLEVLNWKRLVILDGERPEVSSMFKDQAASLGILSRNRIKLHNRGLKSESEICTADPFGVQEILQELARKELPPVAGSRLSKLVVSCLSALEGGFPDLSFDQHNRVKTGMNFIFSVKMALAQVSV